MTTPTLRTDARLDAALRSATTRRVITPANADYDGARTVF